MSYAKGIVLAVGLSTLVPLVSSRAEPPAITAPAVSVAAPEPTAKVLAAATTRAKAEGKQVLVVFHASWCGWCKRLDTTFLNDPAMGKLMAAHYEIVHLDVSEHGDKTSLENPGGDAMMATLGGEKSGLPYMVVLDASGKKLADSNREKDGTNIGYPGSADEIAAFVAILKETSSSMTAAELAQVSTHLTKNAPKG